jgi:hypothetical protein
MEWKVWGVEQSWYILQNIRGNRQHRLRETAKYFTLDGLGPSRYSNPVPVWKCVKSCFNELHNTRREENQLDATESFIELIICLTCFGHLYAHHQELKTRDCSSSFPHPGRIACCPAPDRRPPATKTLHTICGNNTSVVLSAWWWAYKCPKHVEQIISAINHSVASNWFSSLGMNYVCLS